MAVMDKTGYITRRERLLNVNIGHEVMRFHRAHRISRIWGYVVLVGGIRSWTGIDLSPLARTLPGGPFFCCTILEHLSELEVNLRWKNVGCSLFER